MLAAYADPLLTRRSFLGRDLVPYNLPLEKAVHDAWGRGRLPVWFPDASGGRPLLPNPNSGSFYPIRPLLSRVPFPLAMRIYPVAHWAAAGVGMILLLSLLGASRAAAFLGAVTYAFSGVLVSELYYTNFLPGAALLPWALWAVVRPAASPARRILVTALVYGLLFLAGDVVTSALAVLCGLLWISLETEPASRARGAREVAFAVFLGALLALPQILATALLVPETHRAVIGMKLAETLHFSVSPWRLLELVVPYPLGAVWSQDVTAIWAESAFRFFFATLYAGAFPLVALLTFGQTPRPRGARFAVVLALGALVLTVLPGFAPKAMLDWASPIPLRYPEKFCVGLALALALAAGLAFDRFRQVPAPTRRLLGVAALLAAAAAAGGSLAGTGRGGWRSPPSARRPGLRLKPGGSFPARWRKAGSTGPRLWSLSTCCGVPARGRPPAWSS